MSLCVFIFKRMYMMMMHSNKKLEEMKLPELYIDYLIDSFSSGCPLSIQSVFRPFINQKHQAAGLQD